MSAKFPDEKIDKSFVMDVYNAATKSFGDGIYVPSDGHPCGWDWIDFEFVDPFDAGEDNIFVYTFGGSDISNGYGSEDFEDKTLLEILKVVHGQVAFELDQIDW